MGGELEAGGLVGGGYRLRLGVGGPNLLDDGSGNDEDGLED